VAAVGARLSAQLTLGSKVAVLGGHLRASDVYAASTAGECAICACTFRGRPVGEDWAIFCRSERDPSGASSIV